MHWLTAIRCNQDETFASPRNPRRFRNAARNVSCVASRASSSRPRIPYASAKIRRSQRRTISPKASGSPVRARCTMISSVPEVSIRAHHLDAPAPLAAEKLPFADVQRWQISLTPKQLVDNNGCALGARCPETNPTNEPTPWRRKNTCRLYRQIPRMLEKLGRIRLLYI